uniref:Adrenomedullin n=1 Tax=Anolis carolinensis TaxID=28377 RepID=A0A803TWW8_ANOCA
YRRWFLLLWILHFYLIPRHLMASPPVRGCHLGTCQIQNLANLLYRYGGNSQKDESHKNNKGTTDPMGYGRRKRRSMGLRLLQRQVKESTGNRCIFSSIFASLERHFSHPYPNISGLNTI